MEEFVGKQISVIGAARSGIAAARVLVALGASVLLSDSKPSESFDSVVLSEILFIPVQFVGGASVEAALAGAELVITSPGVPKFAPVLQEAVRRNIPVWSEIELAYRITDAPIVATTGTNGKTTTTLLIAAMLDAAGIANIVCGNVSADEIKRSMVEAAFAARDMNPKPVLVAEISSFQLEWVEKFRPRVGILTNITPDHLDRYIDFDDYARTKARLFAAQREDEDYAILNADNEETYRIAHSGLKGNVSCFTINNNPRADAFLPDEVRTGIISPALNGLHNAQNAYAAAIAAMIMGVSIEAVASVVRNFGGVAHRMEFVAEVGGVRFINQQYVYQCQCGDKFAESR